MISRAALWAPRLSALLLTNMTAVHHCGAVFAYSCHRRAPVKTYAAHNASPHMDGRMGLHTLRDAIRISRAVTRRKTRTRARLRIIFSRFAHSPPLRLFTVRRAVRMRLFACCIFAQRTVLPALSSGVRIILSQQKPR